LAVIGLVVLPLIQWLGQQRITLSTDLPTELDLRPDHPQIPRIAQCLLALEAALLKARAIRQLEGGDKEIVAKVSRDNLRKLEQSGLSARALQEYNQLQKTIAKAKKKGPEAILRLAIKLYAKARQDVGQPLSPWEQRVRMVQALHRLLPPTESFFLSPEPYTTLAEGLKHPPLAERYRPLAKISGAWYWQDTLYQELAEETDPPTPAEALALFPLVEATPLEGLPKIKEAIPASHLLERMGPEIVPSFLHYLASLPDEESALLAAHSLLARERGWSPETQQALVRPLLKIGWNWAADTFPEKGKWVHRFLDTFKNSPYGVLQ
jgi:hypothetical protein